MFRPRGAGFIIYIEITYNTFDGTYVWWQKKEKEIQWKYRFFFLFLSSKPVFLSTFRFIYIYIYIIRSLAIRAINKEYYNTQFISWQYRYTVNIQRVVVFFFSFYNVMQRANIFASHAATRTQLRVLYECQDEFI